MIKKSKTILYHVDISSRYFFVCQLKLVLLGVINENLKWKCHVNYITAKASKKLYALRLLKRASVQEQDMLKVFRSSCRPILEYTVQVWQDILDYLSDRIESVQKRAPKIIYPNSSYSQAPGQTLSPANETSLSNRRELLCRKFMAEMTDTLDHPLSCLVSTAVQKTNPNPNLYERNTSYFG